MREQAAKKQLDELKFKQKQDGKEPKHSRKSCSPTEDQ